MILVVKPFHVACRQAAFLFGWAFVVLAIGCGPSNRPEPGPIQSVEYVHWGETQGTTYAVKYHSVDSVSHAVIEEALEAIDREFNLWRPDSRINAINGFNRLDTVFAFDDSLRLWSVLWDRCLEIYDASQGAFDPTVHPLVELWGFGLKNRTVVTPERIAEVMPLVGMTTDRIDLDEVMTDRIYRKSHLRKGIAGVSLDFNSIAQGFTVDLVAESLEEEGVLNYMVEIGGEVRCKGKNRDGEWWRIAIDHPGISSETVRPLEAIVSVKNAAICTSGSYRKYYEENGVRRSHTISPFSGYPVEHDLLSATVQAADAATADALATACMVWGPEEGRVFIEAYRSDNPKERVEAFFISAQQDGSFEFWKTGGWGDALQRLNP